MFCCRAFTTHRQGVFLAHGAGVFLAHGAGVCRGLCLLGGQPSHLLCPDTDLHVTQAGRGRQKYVTVLRHRKTGEKTYHSTTTKKKWWVCHSAMPQKNRWVYCSTTPQKYRWENISPYYDKEKLVTMLQCFDIEIQVRILQYDARKYRWENTSNDMSLYYAKGRQGKHVTILCYRTTG